MPEDFDGQSTGMGESTDFGGSTDDVSADDNSYDGETEGSQEDPIVEFDGKEYKASDLRNYIQGGLRQSDYTRKTQELSRERQQIAELRQAAEAWQTIQEHPQLVQSLGQAIAGLLQGDQQGGQPASGAPGQFPSPESAGQATPEWQAHLQRMQQQMSGVLGAYDQRFQEYNKYLWDQYYANRDAHARSQLDSLKAKYPFLVAEEVTAAFRDNPNFQLEDIAKSSSAYWQKQYQNWRKGDVEKRQENANARVAVPGAKGGASAVKTEQPQQWEDAMKSALERLKKTGYPVR